MQILQKILSNHFKSELKIELVKNLSGGCVSQVFKVVTSQGDYCIKTGEHSQLEVLETEADGLKLLAEKSQFRVPEIIATGLCSEISYLVMEYVPITRLDQIGWEKAGKALALLHQNTRENFGLDSHNYIAGLIQNNSSQSRWPDFFIDNRLEPQLKLAFDNKLIESSFLEKFGSCYSRISSIFPEEPPALLHGDLWSGNIAADDIGYPFIYDPAIYFGHREIELSFTKLFGGFPQCFYEVYDDNYPIADGFEDRVEVYNLYPLLVHLNLFGSSYLDSIIRIVNRLQ